MRWPKVGNKMPERANEACLLENFRSTADSTVSFEVVIQQFEQHNENTCFLHKG